MGFLKAPGKTIGKFGNNITGAMGTGISDVFITPLSSLTDVATGAFSDITSSPLLYVMFAGVAIVMLKGMSSAESVSTTALQNPESIRAIASAIR